MISGLASRWHYNFLISAVQIFGLVTPLYNLKNEDFKELLFMWVIFINV